MQAVDFQRFVGLIGELTAHQCEVLASVLAGDEYTKAVTLIEARFAETKPARLDGIVEADESYFLRSEQGSRHRRSPPRGRADMWLNLQCELSLKWRPSASQDETGTRTPDNVSLALP